MQGMAGKGIVFAGLVLGSILLLLFYMSSLGGAPILETPTPEPSMISGGTSVVTPTTFITATSYFTPTASITTTPVYTPSASITATPFFTPTVSVTSTATQRAQPEVEAFPGAEGFGKHTRGGRGGRVIYVTNLNDTGEGSFREALTAVGPRMVVFEVSGTIDLQDDITVREPYITIAGQTAPGEGVQIKGGMLKIQTHDVIIRYLKVRMGNPNGGNPSNTDPVSLTAQGGDEVYNVIIDHCALVWGTDIGGLSILTNVHDVTVQDSILGEGLNHSSNPESPHSKGVNITQLDTSSQPTRITIYRNLITTSNERNPQVQGAVNIDIVSNVIYNWGEKSSFGNPRSLNLINNFYITGPESFDVPAWSLRTNPENPEAYPGSVYEQGNALEGIEVVRGGPGEIYASARFSPYSIANEMTPEAAYDFIVANAGAILPVRDSVDQRIIDQLIARTGYFLDAEDLAWPELVLGALPVDSDRDGMSDLWEEDHFDNLDTASAASDFDRDGYTDLEEYLNGTDPNL
jgi:hypothetical protein